MLLGVDENILNMSITCQTHTSFHGYYLDRICSMTLTANLHVYKLFDIGLCIFISDRIKVVPLNC